MYVCMYVYARKYVHTKRRSPGDLNAQRKEVYIQYIYIYILCIYIYIIYIIYIYMYIYICIYTYIYIYYVCVQDDEIYICMKTIYIHICTHMTCMYIHAYDLRKYVYVPGWGCIHFEDSGERFCLCSYHGHGHGHGRGHGHGIFILATTRKVEEKTQAVHLSMAPRGMIPRGPRYHVI
jgi:hypothetical protein